MSSKILKAATVSNVLCIDTSQPETVLGLNGTVTSWVSKQNQSKELLPKIDRLLKSKRVAKEKIRGVAVNLGPGSFTGLRVGVTVANGFGYGLKIPVLGMSEFDVVKKIYPKVDVIVLDARRNEVFVQKKSTAPKLIEIKKLAREIKRGESVYVDSPELVARVHQELGKAGTIYVANLSRQDKMQAMLDRPKLPKKFAQVMPMYVRGANITKPKKK